jgi:hypothetical protein
MRVLTPQVHEFARRLIACEATANGGSGAEAFVAFRVCHKLEGSLSKLMGRAAFGALFSRALTLAKTEAPCLRPIQIASDGSLTGHAEWAAQNPDDAAAGETVLVACLLGLLTTFIGKPLTTSIVQASWPNLSFDDLDSEYP